MNTMPKSTQRSIRSQLMLMTSGLVIIIIIFTFILAKSYGQRAAQISFDRLLIGAAVQIAENTNLVNGEVLVNLPWSAFETLAAAPDDRVFYQITNQDGRHLTGYTDLPSPPIEKNADADNRNYSPLPQFFDDVYSGELMRFISYSKLLTETDYSGEIQILIGQTVQAREAMANEISWRAIQLVVPFFLAGLTLVILGIWKLLKPINKLNQALTHRTASDLSPINLPVPAELEQLVSTINHFMTQLSSTLDRLKRFTSEAAHQLRTPLAGLKSQAQNALTEPDENTRNTQLNRVIQSCDMLNNTITQLLSQATLAHRFQSQPLEKVELDSVTKQVCRDVAVAALHQDIEISFTGDSPVHILGDDFALQQMIRNFLENAIKYSPKSSKVEVELFQDDSSLYKSTRLLIKDYGIGIPEEEKAHVFERFYRSANNPRSGSGLGLAIAKEVAEHHNAKLQLQDNSPQGLIVELIFSQYKG